VLPKPLSRLHISPQTGDVTMTTSTSCIQLVIRGKTKYTPGADGDDEVLGIGTNLNWTS